MTEMTEKEGGAKIRKGLSARRDSTSYQVTQEIVIPAGTILRSMGDGRFTAAVGDRASFTLVILPGTPPPHFFKAVISS